MRAAALCCAAAASGVAAIGDLQRSRTKVPREEYRGGDFYQMGKVLNGHIARSHPNTKPCHQWTSEELQEFQAMVYARREPRHDAIYRDAGDNRALRHASLDEHKAHWARIGAAAGSHQLLNEMRRDAHCHEAVMWWVHHLSHSARGGMTDVAVPHVPLVEWRKPAEEEGAAAAEVYEGQYNPSSNCQACHGGGVPWQNPDTQPAPYPRQVNHMDRQRRCEEWYGPEEGGKCNACEGIAGAYWGDMPDEGFYPSCEIVANASDVPVADRMSTHFPKAFAVEMRGADRWPRSSASANASCNYTTDCNPIAVGDKEIGDPQAGTNGHNYHWYASIHGVLYLDHFDGMFGGGRLRHETVYQFPNGREGAANGLLGLNGETNKHLTEIHIQTRDQAQTNNPGVMLNLEHSKMTKANASGTDDTKLDWRRIPSSDGFCTCIPDPAGLPDFYGAYSNATYLGRVRFVPPWHVIGTGARPDGKPLVMDHYVKWTFHLFVDTASRMPAMFSSPFGGCATYGNWTLNPDAMWPASVGGGWRANPEKGLMRPEGCINPKKSKDCPAVFPWSPDRLKTPAPKPSSAQ